MNHDYSIVLLYTIYVYINYSFIFFFITILLYIILLFYRERDILKCIYKIEKNI